VRLKASKLLEVTTFKALQELCEEKRGAYTNKPGPTWRIPKEKPETSPEPEGADKTEPKLARKPRLNHAETPSLGVPNALKNVAHEKATVPVTVKLQPTLAEYVRKKGGSTFIRQVLLEKLAEETESEAQEA